MIIEEVIIKKEKLESQIAKMLRNFHTETNLIITSISIQTNNISYVEIIVGVKTEIKYNEKAPADNSNQGS